MSRDSAFLGTGWGFPPTFKNEGADVGMVSGTDDIRESLEILLSTRIDERNMRFDYGCELKGFLFSEINQRLILEIKDVISNAILKHEPRIKLDKVSVSEDKSTEGMLVITIDYTVRITNARYNLVYPFYVNEANASLL